MQARQVRWLALGFCLLGLLAQPVEAQIQSVTFKTTANTKFL